MPPLEALKALRSLMVTLKIGRGARKSRSLKLSDISRAHFYGESKRRVFVTLPEGDEEEGCCTLLKRTMYGTQDASNIWCETWIKHLNKADIVEGKANLSLIHI